MNSSVLRAVFKRNFVNYFANPTGYVFICVFVVLSALAAFWPNEFFNRNLANLDQLSYGFMGFPLIMLVFIPAVTMAIWADERRQGTDELLLTIPAGDFEIVLGKYLAALAIFTVSLLLSLFCNYLVLNNLANPNSGFSLYPYVDFGLFCGTYVGYWLIGVAMLGIGMVASFLTGNLTVAYILGVIFNVPLVFAMYADSIFDRDAAMAVKQWSLSEQFRDFGRGVLSLSGLAYFAMILAVTLYLSMVFIGRRHWRAAQGTMSNAVFYPMLHLLWAASFVTFGIFLAQHFPLPAVIVSLLVAYVLLHALLVWGWSAASSNASQTPTLYLAPALQAALLGVFVLVALAAHWWEDQPEHFGKVLLGLFIAYAVAHLALAIGWWRFPHRASLLPGHYIVRFLALVLAAAGLTVLLRGHDLRLDVTQERLSSLSPATVDLLKNLEAKRAVVVEAFVSPEVPELYIQTRQNLISTLQEIQARAGGKVEVRINNTDQYSDEADRAKRQFNITPHQVSTPTRGTYKDEQIFLGVAVSCGREKQVVPFIDRGLSPEYEIVRSLAGVTQQKKKRLGVLETDVPLMSRFDPQGGEWPIIEELRKQYDVVQVSAASPITERFDVLLAAQPSSLPPEQMENFLNAVRNGQPTAIFEDPYPFWASNVPGTTAPRRPPGGMMSNPMMQQNLPKGDITPLWNLLGIRFAGDKGDAGDQIVYQYYNPIKKLERITDRYPEFVFVDKGCGAKEPFSGQSEITSGLQHLLFPFPGYIAKLNAPALENMEFTPLVETGEQTGTVRFQDLVNPMAMYMGGDPINADRARDPRHESFVLAARIRGKLRPNPKMAAEKKDTGAKNAKDPKATKGGKDAKAAEKKDEPKEVNVVLVADIDMLHPAFFELRAQGEIPDMGLSFDFDDITFVLNALDDLAGDKRFIDIRKRRAAHRTLVKIDEQTQAARKETDAAIKQLQDNYAKVIKDEEKALREDVKALREQMEKEKLNPIEVLNRVGMVQEARQQKLDAKTDELKRKRAEDETQINTKLNREVNRVRNGYKLGSVLLPFILPLLVGAVVFGIRRSREREGVSRTRLRS